MWRLARKPLVALGLGAISLVAPSLAEPVLHERFDPDPAEDLRFGATTPSGSMPATIETRSGVIAAPEESRTPATPDEHAYGGPHTPTSADSSYHLDRLTTRPDRVRYDEPFRPSVLPFKRLYAFDRLKPDLSFEVSDGQLSRVAVGGSVEHTEDVFFADFNVDLVAKVPVRIPSVGPMARIRAYHVDPPQEVEIVEDSAENWFVRGTLNGRVRLVMQLSIDRRVFGSAFRPVTWVDLAPHVTAVPDEVSVVAASVLEHIGVGREDSPARALGSLVDYFRRFRESSQLPQSTNSLDLYRELSFDQKGVCRHRAYAFAVTALSLGLPTRIVHNEAHAWVEVFDTELWHRVDLGGAATNVQQSRRDPLAPQHRPPRDPFAWPEGSTSARQLAASRTATTAPRRGAGDSDDAPSSNSQDDLPKDAPRSWPSASQSTVSQSKADDLTDASADSAGAPDVSLRLGKSRLLRGLPLPVSGKASRKGRPCRLARVDIYVESSEGQRAIGSVATNREGAFEGHVTLPPTIPVGRLELSARVAGGCD